MKKFALAALLLLAPAAISQGISFTSISAVSSLPNDTISASWTDLPANGKQWWSVFNVSGGKVASGSMFLASGSYTVTVSFVAPSPNKIMFQVCDNLTCKSGPYIVPSSGNASYKSSLTESNATVDGLKGLPSGSGTRYQAPLVEVSVTADVLVILPRSCGIPENLVTSDALAASASSSSGDFTGELLEGSATVDAITGSHAGLAAIGESEAPADAVAIRHDAHSTVAESVPAAADVLSLRLAVTFPQSCNLSVSGSIVTCTIP